MGNKEWDNIANDFPNHNEAPFEKTSDETTSYNCIAWACGDSRKWYWPQYPYYWPSNVKKEITLDAFIQLFFNENYRMCANGDLLEGYEKIAIYVNKDGIPTHAARQLANGLWTSKLGRSHDVSHTISAMRDSRIYGNVQVYMQRQIKK